MSNVTNAVPLSKKKEDVNLVEIKKAIAKGKWIIFASMLLFTITSALLAMRLPNMYTSEVVLIPSGERATSKLPGQLSGLAALAGVNLGGSGDKSALAIEILKSKEFQANFIKNNNLETSIYAVTNWDRSSNTLIIDPEIYDIKTATWVRKVENPFKPEPSRLELVTEFNKFFNISVEKTTGIVKLSFKHYSPIVAKNILDSLVIDINENIRNRDLTDSQLSIEFLTNEISKTNLSDVKSMLFSLVEEQTKNIMIANTRKEYVFKVIDPAVIPELKSEPKRAIIVLSSFLIGLIVGSLFSIRRYYQHSNE